jgi:hypothetical protein
MAAADVHDPGIVNGIGHVGGREIIVHSGSPSIPTA